MGTADVDDLKDRLSALEAAHNGTDRAVAVLSNQMNGVIRLLWMILGALIVGIVGAFITAWVQIPSGQYNPTTPGVEAPR